MNYILLIIVLIAGFILGLGAAFILRLVQAKSGRELADELFRESEAQRKAQVDAVVENVKAVLAACLLMPCQNQPRNFSSWQKRGWNQSAR
jgi:Tfp pilus assembly protein PilO